MRYYNSGDDIYLFGFSRGAYTARFLAEMLDHVGLLSAGNEEMSYFAWKTFQRWQRREERNEGEKEQKQALLEYMRSFRETFSRPVKPVRHRASWNKSGTSRLTLVDSFLGSLRHGQQRTKLRNLVDAALLPLYCS